MSDEKTAIVQAVKPPKPSPFLSQLTGAANRHGHSETGAFIVG